MLLLNSEMPLLRSSAGKTRPPPPGRRHAVILCFVLRNSRMRDCGSPCNAEKYNKPESPAGFSSQRYWPDNIRSGFSVTASFLPGTGAYKNKVRQAEAEQQVQEAQLSRDRTAGYTQKQTARLDVGKASLCCSFTKKRDWKTLAAIIEAATLSYHAGNRFARTEPAF